MFGEDWRIAKSSPSYILDYRQQLAGRAPARTITSKSGEWSGTPMTSSSAYNLARQALKTRLGWAESTAWTYACAPSPRALANCLVRGITPAQGITVVGAGQDNRLNPGDFRTSELLRRRS